MLRKKIRISRWFLSAVLVYTAFVSILFVRMKIAERMLTEYYEADACPSTSNCREMVSAMVLEAASKKISFINYGFRGLPLQRRTFREYQFKLSVEGAATKVVKVFPGAPSDPSRFDVANIYIPVRLDEPIANLQVLDGTSVGVEVWHERVTLITVAVPVIEQTGEPTPGSLSIGPPGKTQELTLATEAHPVIVAESSRNDFAGWTSGLLLVGLPILISGLDWLFRKGRAGREKKTN